jgi:pimeloyl-ACP methyl ester carboxylesterase
VSHEDAKVPRPNVLFVHGLWMNGLETLWLRHRVEGHGFQAHPFSYPSLHATVEEVVDRLDAAIAGLEPPVHLVGHSLGGLMLLRLFDLRPQQPPGRVVLLGSPVSGSTAARSVARWTVGPAIIGRIALEEIVAAPPRRWIQPRELGVVAGTVSAGLGRLVTNLPQPNDGTVTLLETQLEGMSDHVALPTTHTGMLFSGSVAEEIASFLINGRFLASGRPPTAFP